MLALAASAQATLVAAVIYSPPKIAYVDQVKSGTQEHVTATKDGHDFLFVNTNGTVAHPESEPGCEGSFMEYRCPVAGIEKMVFNVRALDDEVEIDLGSKADKVKQILKGGEGADTLTGGPGRQIIDGGPGTDDCSGGPGRDVIRNCE